MKPWIHLLEAENASLALEKPFQVLDRLSLQLMSQLESGQMAEGFTTAVFQRPEGGKMVGLLLAEAEAGEFVYLKAFSGQYGELWEVPGWAPPVFPRERLGIQRNAEERVYALTEIVQGLSETSRRQKAAVRLRRHISRKTMLQVFETYVFENGLREKANLLELFSPAVPPWGAGDCAAPKLLFHALKEGLKPKALTEFWWGKTARSNERVQGAFYAPCEARCGPILRFLARGLNFNVLSG